MVGTGDSDKEVGDTEEGTGRREGQGEDRETARERKVRQWQRPRQREMRQVRRKRVFSVNTRGRRPRSKEPLQVHHVVKFNEFTR